MSALVVLASLMIGMTVGVFGGGGSVLTVPALAYGLELDPKVAIASSLGVVSVTSMAGALPHARAVRWDVFLRFGLASVVGAYAGGRAAEWVPGPVLFVLFASMMIVSAIYMIRSRGEPTPGRGSPLLLLVQGFGVGFFTGLVGAGGGFLVVPALVGLAGLGIREAIATSLVVLAAKSVAAFAGQLGHVEIDWRLVGTFTTGTVVGAFAGGKLGTRLAPTTLTRGFAVLILAIATYMLWREVPNLVA